ncbi:hypothetical protein [Clavibacter capsici]|uniref:hypothetical protein n=1 Tax=Clavibacter capsici TaxID=1874630 RepID=UPI00293E83C8|nr:hypothetical protein [Clavibacter capsici]
MSDPTTPGGPADAPAEGDDGSKSTNTALGVVFGMLGLALMLTLDDTRVAGLPFLILGVTFFVMGIRPATRERDRAAGDDAPPPTA